MCVMMQVDVRYEWPRGGGVEPIQRVNIYFFNIVEKTSHSSALVILLCM